MLRQYDRTMEVKMNRHPDSEWYVKPLIIKEGDHVLVKRDALKKRNDMPYNTTPSIEFDKKGSIVIAEAKNVSSVTRNISFFKTVWIEDE